MFHALQAGNKYYLTAGIEYSNEAYVWVAQSEITAVPSGVVSKYISFKKKLNNSQFKL